MGATPVVRWVGKLGGLAMLVGASTLALADGGVTAPAAGVTVARSGAASSASVPAGAPPARAASAHSLDLSLPPLRLVLTPQQLAELTAQSDDGPMQDVTVRDPPYVTPVPTGQVRALTWALLHPLDAWRIFAPITSD